MEQDITFGLPVLLYFFLSGTSGGAFICATLLTIFSKGEKIEKIALYEALISLVCLTLGAIFLFLDLGNPLRVWRLFMIPALNPTSPISWGSIIIPAHFGMLCVYIFALLAKKEALARRTSYAGLFIGTAIITYTGFLLSVCKGYALWHSAILVPLFLASGCLSGLSLLIIIGIRFKFVSSTDALFVFFRRALLCLLLVEGLVFTDYYVLYTGFLESYEVAKLVLFGRLAALFWIGETLLGLILPIVILLSSFGKTEKGLVTASVLSIVGVFVMRYIIVIGGQMASIL